MRKERSDFAQLLTLEMGKLLQEAGGEVDLSADILDYYADNAEKFLASKQLKVDEGEAIVENAPLGVIFCVEPWNFPYYQLRSEEHTSELQSPDHLVCRLLLEKKKKTKRITQHASCTHAY